MLSRMETPFEIQNLKMSQETVILSNEELAFTQEEVISFFRETKGMKFAVKQLKIIHRATEGWIGGLILLSELLGRLPGKLRYEYLSEDIPDQFRGEIFKYFNDEIFSHQSGSTQEFLIKSSIFDIVEPDFVRDFIGTPEAQEILQSLVDRNLFVQSVYTREKGWQYRYHQLFRDALLEKFESGLEEAEKRFLFSRAGTLYEQKGMHEDALKCFIKAKNYPKAASSMEKVGITLQRSGRNKDLAQWLNTFPEDLLRENPWLLFFLCLTRRFTSPDENIRNLQRAYALFERRRDLKGRLLSLAFMIEASIYRGRDKTPLALLLDRAEALLKSLIGDFHPYEKATLWLQIGFGLILRGGDLRKGLTACHNAYLIAKDLGDLQNQVGALVNALIALSWLGEFKLAEETSEKIEDLLLSFPHPELRALHLMYYSHLCVCNGDFSKGLDFSRRAQKEMEGYGLVYLYPVALFYDLLFHSFLGEHAVAEEVGQRSIDFATSMDNRFLEGAALLFLSGSFYRKGDYKKAKKLIERSFEILSSHEARAEMHLNMIKVQMSLISFHLAKTEGLDKNLHEALDYFTSISSFPFMAETHFAIAFVKWEQSKAGEAITQLRAGFKIAQQRKYHHFGSMNKKDLANACILAIELDIGEAVEYASHLLSSKLASHAGRDLDRLEKHPNLKVREKVREIRHKIYRSTLRPIHIYTLGTFEIFRGESSIEEKEWEGNQPKALLKAIIAHEFQSGVSKEVLAVDLWPDSSSQAAERNFKVTLHRLRKALEPGMKKAFGASYIQLRSNLIFLDEDLVKVDVNEFLCLVAKGQTKEKEGNLSDALSNYTEALEKYQGDFLPNDLYASWAQIKRDKLRENYTRLLFIVASIHESRGAFTKAILYYKKLIETDPVLEEAYQRLMVLYSDHGRKNEAIRIYRTCKKAVRAHLDTDPEMVTTAIYEKILDTV